MLMKSFIEEFKEFALRGNMMDMAVGVIIGFYQSDSEPGNTRGDVYISGSGKVCIEVCL